MPYTCQTCARRKVRCDKTTPTCSACRKSQLDCLYQAPRPRTGKRKLDEDILERLARYENILIQHGLLPDSEREASSSSMVSTAVRESETPGSGTEQPVSLLWDAPEGAKAGKLRAHGNDKSQTTYVNSSLWQKLEEHHLQSQSDDDDDDDVNVNDQTPASPSTQPHTFPSDPWTEAFLGLAPPPPVPLTQHYPPPDEAFFLWTTYTSNVDPLVKILHTPSILSLIENTTQNPTTISRSPDNGPLLFAIYHFAIFSLPPSSCLLHLHQPRPTLLTKYHSLTLQALSNTWTTLLQAPSLPLLQALILFLIPSRTRFHPTTYWLLTGTAVRLAQRLGIHRDGAALGLPPFETEMRRRLFYTLMPLDARASQFAGMGAPVWPGGWDTRPPRNVNDIDIWPGMKDGEVPVERKGVTEMVFCLARVCVGGYFLQSDAHGHGPMMGQFRDAAAASEMADRAEAEVEEKFLRYCDVVNPLHFLTACMVRAGIATLRLRIVLPHANPGADTDADPGAVKEAFSLAMKILKSDDTLCSHPGLQKYWWHTGSFFVWGTWDAFIFVLTTLLKRRGLVRAEEVREAWDGVEAMYRHHEELVGSKRALYRALRRLTVKAWDAGGLEEEPGFVGALRALRSLGSSGRVDENEQKQREEIVSGQDGQPVPGSDFGHGSGTGNDPSLPSFEPEENLEPEETDWDFWTQLIQDHDMDMER
ncbi:putative C6 transcription factor [Dichotomopilus funicola]|uniref:C6 transcription factor n=1 Tax=Dichotomopilus funicola TaxID=1934379 RepID=A0AAN6UXR5_9PEZI|nr:putative C6 transcription factor [Dichotomopilus funicola]